MNLTAVLLFGLVVKTGIRVDTSTTFRHLSAETGLSELWSQKLVFNDFASRLTLKAIKISFDLIQDLLNLLDSLDSLVSMEGRVLETRNDQAF